jgi:DNA-binding response OmpR family regulator
MPPRSVATRPTRRPQHLATRSRLGERKRTEETVVPKILIVDDDPDIVDAGRLVLEREGYEVVGAPNRADGMKKLEEIKPDLLILDVMMEEPDDGLRMAREIRKNGNELPIIMLTSVNAAMGLNIDKDGEIVPVDEFQPKPVEPQTLVAKVKKLLEQ